MRLATWNVNSLKARQEAVERWLDRAAPDILLIQETKLTDGDAPVMAFAMTGYQLVHHGEGRWNGVAIAAREGLPIDDVVTNFGDGPVRDSGPGGAGARSRRRMTSTRSTRRAWWPRPWTGCGSRASTRPNGRVVGSPFYDGKLAWFDRLRRWTADELTRVDALVIGGDLNVAPTDIGRLERGGRSRRDARLGARTGGVPGAAGPWFGGRVPRPARRTGPLLVVGLPGGEFPQEPRHADRPPPRRRRPSPHGSSTPRSTARRARVRRCRRITRR